MIGARLRSETKKAQVLKDQRQNYDVKPQAYTKVLLKYFVRLRFVLVIVAILVISSTGKKWIAACDQAVPWLTGSFNKQILLWMLTVIGG